MKRRDALAAAFIGGIAPALAVRGALAAPLATGAPPVTMREYAVPPGSHPHDVACSGPSPEAGIWFTAQTSGHLGWLDPVTEAVHLIPLAGPGQRSGPHGVVVAPDGGAWITDGGLNAIVRVDPITHEVRRFPLPSSRANANLNTAAFDARGLHYFTGQNGVYGRLDPANGEMQVFDAPRGRGPYGITATPAGQVYYVSLAGSHLAWIEPESGEARVIQPPTPNQGARRVWSDSRGRLWISEWISGQLSRFEPAPEDPTTGEWRAWKLPGARPQAYAVYVDDLDHVWVTDFGANALVRFDPETETFESFPHPRSNAAVRQLLGRPGEVWGALSGQDKLVVMQRQPVDAAA